MQNKITMYTDGGARNNPGPAGIGVWIFSKDGQEKAVDKKYAEYIGKKTNNEAEYEALIFGLKKIKSLLGKANAKQAEIECFLDSELIVKQLDHQYKLQKEHIQKYFIEVWNLMLDYHKVNFTHIPREKNKIADGLVNKAIDAEIKQQILL